MADLRPFHLAFPVRDLDAARHFYVDVLGCRCGRESERWLDFDFFGHQITAHLSTDRAGATGNSVDGDTVPVRHFGVILPVTQWESLAARLQQRAVHFLLAPRVRFAGAPGEQHTMFVTDPSGNALEFKAFADDKAIFARD